MKNRVLKLILPLATIAVLYSLSHLEAKEAKINKTSTEQLEIKHLASEEIIRKIAQNELEKSWINASIISVEKDNSSKWVVVFENSEKEQKNKKMNILLDSNGNILESRLI